MTKVKQFLRFLIYFYMQIFWKFPPVELWKKFLMSHIENLPVVADVGGGKGEIAHYLAPFVKAVYILDKEETSLQDADSSMYSGSLTHAYRDCQSENIIPIKGDATNMPFADASIDVITSSELIEHLDNREKKLFIRESERSLKDGGMIIMMAPNATFIEKRKFWFPAFFRKLIPKQWVLKLPGLLRGPWLEQTVEQWEAKVGHYDRGCKLTQIQSICDRTGFKEIDHRFMHTSKTFFWHQLMFTFPLLYILLVPLIRFSYFLEANSDTEDGASFMGAFRKSSTLHTSPNLKD
jgi:ubiquinone/menaquinone biosynthesis C-methylase UbiE